MIATLANGGVFHTPHVVKSITDGTVVKQAAVAHHQVLTPAQAADVDYAISQDFSPLGTANGLGMKNGQVAIGKTGTTNLAQSAFFEGATPREALAVGMFVSHPGCTLPKSEQSFCTSTSALSYAPPAGLETLFGVGGTAGYGGQWPAIIWHDYMNREFDSQSILPWPPVNNDGQKWVLSAKAPRHKRKPSPSPSPSCRGNWKHCRPSPSPSPSPTPTSTCQPPIPCPSPTASLTAGPAAAALGSVNGPAAGTAIAGTVLFGGVVAVALPARRRRRPGLPPDVEPPAQE